jgi:hypothetical protein
MPQRRRIQFSSPSDVIADLERLRAGPYQRLGTWSLEQVAWHCMQAIPSPLIDVPPAPPTDDQKKFQGLLQGFIDAPEVPAGFPAAVQIVPPANPDPSTVDELIKRLESLDTFNGMYVPFGPAGIAPFNLVRQFAIAHCRHHLSFLIPQAQRRTGVRYQNFDEVIADVKRLRAGCTQAGKWSLAQVCWHLNVATNRVMANPVQDETPEQLARKPLFAQVLSSGSLPSGIEGPAPIMPPADAPESSIDDFLATLEKLKTHTFGPGHHRLFGNLTGDELRQSILIHSAHHLSHLCPASS